MRIPRYDKSAHAGAGDRADVASWPSVRGPVHVVLFEGWMLGFRPLGIHAAAAVHEGLPFIDSALEAYQDAWDSFVDSWLVIKVRSHVSSDLVFMIISSTIGIL